MTVNPYLHGNYAPVLEECSDDYELPVTGFIPPDLDGRLLRNGPNPAVVPADESDYHWFSGDGMVHAVSLGGGKALGYKHGTHVDFNLPKIGKYDVSNATEHYKICSRPVDGDARVSNLLLTMLQRVDVKVDKFQDRVGPISQIVA